MELYEKFPMPSFTRIQWASKKIKDVWETRFNNAYGLFHRLEKESVIHGLRNVTTGHIPHHMYNEVVRDLNKKGLIYLPLVKIAPYSGRMNYHPPVREGQPWTYYGVIANNITDAEAFAHATEIDDHKSMGKLLGYPECCSEAFEETFRKGYTDPIWQQAMNTNEKHIVTKEDNLIRLKNTPWEINPMLNIYPIGVQFHLKCSFDCEHSLKMARDWIDLGNKIDVKGLKEVEMFLRMPMEWDCWKGIAYIRSPLFKIAYNSNQSKQKFIVQVEGDYYPEDGANGKEFPYSEKTPIAFMNMVKGKTFEGMN